jgi:hypothetical protein
VRENGFSISNPTELEPLLCTLDWLRQDARVFGVGFAGMLDLKALGWRALVKRGGGQRRAAQNLLIYARSRYQEKVFRAVVGWQLGCVICLPDQASCD